MASLEEKLRLFACVLDHFLSNRAEIALVLRGYVSRVFLKLVQRTSVSCACCMFPDKCEVPAAFIMY